jgi:hypothetical protein
MYISGADPDSEPGVELRSNKPQVSNLKFRFGLSKLGPTCVLWPSHLRLRFDGPESRVGSADGGAEWGRDVEGRRHLHDRGFVAICR